MRHQVKIKHFNRDTKARKALLRGLVRSFIEFGYITTTIAKAKETKRLSDKLIAKAKQGDLNTRRVLHRFFGKRDIVNTLVDKVAPLFPKRNSGFSRIMRLGKRRGDNTKMVRLELVKQKLDQTLKSGKKYPSKVKISAKKIVKKKVKTKKTAVKKKTVVKKIAAKKAVRQVKK